MAATTWEEPFATFDLSKWGGDGGSTTYPTILGGGKVRFQNAPYAYAPRIIHAPFGVQGSLSARSWTMAYTIYPGELLGEDIYFCFGSNNQGTYASCICKTADYGIYFLDAGLFGEGQPSISTNRIDGAPLPSAPFEVRVGITLDAVAGTITSIMAIDGIIAKDDVQTGISFSWDTFAPTPSGWQSGYKQSLMWSEAGDHGGIKGMTIGGVYGTHGGTVAENRAWVLATTQNLLAPDSIVNGVSMALASPMPYALPMIYSRNKADVEAPIGLYGSTVTLSPATYYAGDFPVGDGEVIWCATVLAYKYGGSPTDSYVLSPAFAVTVPTPAHPLALYGEEYQGFERGYSVETHRKIEWADTLGFAPVGIPYAPADKDEWIVDAELWVSATQATALEAAVPPFGVPSSLTICVPNRGGENTFAGLTPAAFGTVADVYVDPVVLEWESLGQKGPRLDLYGYRIKFSLSCSSTSNPYSSNPATAPTTTPPAWLLNKFRAHQIQDGSVEARVIGANGKWTGSANPIKSGRRRDLNFNLDHLSPAQMDELVAFYRGIRSNAFSLQTDATPLPNLFPHQFKAVGLSFQRGAGLWWDATLELVRA